MGVDALMAAIADGTLRYLNATAAQGLLSEVAAMVGDLPDPSTLVDPKTGFRNGGENLAVISAIKSPWSYTDVKELQPYFESSEVRDTGFLAQGLIQSPGLFSGRRSIAKRRLK